MWTNNGLNLVATAVQTNGAQVAMQYVGISPGCGSLASAITAGTPLTALTLNAPGLPANLAAGQSLTVTDGTNSETVTVAAGGATASATSVPITSWTPAYSYAANTAGVCPTPQATDATLYGESQRVGVAGASAGSNPGESLISGYFDGTQPTGVYLLVGYFGGSAATGSVGTGTLMTENIEYWSHVQYDGTYMFQDDNTI